MIVVLNPLPKNPSEVRLRERDQKVDCRSRKFDQHRSWRRNLMGNRFAAGSTSILIFRRGSTRARLACRDGVGSYTGHTTDVEVNAQRQMIRMEAVCSGSAPLVTMM